jgi:WD40 repeat protein
VVAQIVDWRPGEILTGPGKHYRAFISYSWQDKAWGKRIHSWLETYRVPVPNGQEELPKRLGRFFRDDEDMAASSDIASIVRSAIEGAESLIVICSPRSAQSKWVDAEIRHFRSTGRGGKVFAVIVDGVPNSGDPKTECFPPALRAAGDTDHPDNLPIEPMGLDVRRDGHERSCTRLAAGLLEVDFDDLWRRDRRRMLLHRSLWAGGGIFGAIVLSAAIGFGVLAQMNGRTAHGLSVQFLKARAQSDVVMGRYATGARYALAGLQLSPQSGGEFQPVLASAIVQASNGYNPDDRVAWAFSPDGERILAESDDRRALLLQTANGRELAKINGEAGVPPFAAFSADGSRVLTQTSRGVIAVWNASDGRRLTQLSRALHPGLMTAISPDGQVLATASKSGAAELRSATDGRMILTLPDPYGGDQLATFSADGKRVAFGGPFGFKIFELRNGAATEIMGEGGVGVTRIRFSPDGGDLLAADLSGEVTLWHVASGSLAERCGDPSSRPVAMAFSHDGSRIAVGGGTGARIFDKTCGAEIFSLGVIAETVGTLAFSPDGQMVATANHDGRARVWDAASGRLIASLGENLGWIADVFFSEDGGLLFVETTDLGVRVLDLSALKLPLSDLARSACLDLLGDDLRKFGKREIQRDPDLRNVWPRPERDVCQGHVTLAP